MARGRFLSKLMGGGEEEELEDMIEEEVVEENNAEEPEAEQEESATIKTKGRSKKPSRVDVGEGSPQPTGESEGWVNEYEGQLTLDVYQTKDNVMIKSTIAGVKAEDLDITIANDMVTIRGERKKDEEVRAEDYFYQECYWGPFSRSIILPVDIDVEGVNAEIKDGILTVMLPKAAKAKTKKIRVKGSV
ncbi:MAG: Hsp20/alpha crystallin family protein [Candidatus Doudnabacteria bacterium]|nr:Hsp20/alpha crystallin family protein [Candidatus Doudnabacteria bacterium]